MPKTGIGKRVVRVVEALEETVDAVESIAVAAKELKEEIRKAKPPPGKDSGTN